MVICIVTGGQSTYVSGGTLGGSINKSISTGYGRSNKYSGGIISYWIVSTYNSGTKV